MTVHGQHLLWHSARPPWFCDVTDESDMAKVLETHIKTVAGHYGARIGSWDVVNEAIDPGDNGPMGLRLKDTGDCGDDGSIPKVVRDVPWIKLSPNDPLKYIRQAFEWAHEASPQTKLYYNDYGAEDGGTSTKTKTEAVYELAKKLVDGGVPIHGVGLQSHFLAAYPPDFKGMAANMRRLNALGLDVRISELDVEIRQKDEAIASKEQQRQQQAQIYGETLRTCLQAPSCSALLVFGFSDKHTWLTDFGDEVWEQEPLIFDKNYQPKPAYHALKNVLLGK
jgi:endo-1,4-beta-xylanase